MARYHVPELFLEPLEDRPIDYCAWCGGEIYEGEAVYEIDGEWIHEDCLTGYTKQRFLPYKINAEWR